MESKSQQKYIFRNFISFFGRVGIKDLLSHLRNIDYAMEIQFSKWNEICKLCEIDYIDWDLIGAYRRYAELEMLTDIEHTDVLDAMAAMDMVELTNILNRVSQKFIK